MNDNKKHIVLCITPAWIMQASVLITSILYFNKDEFTFHIVGKGFSSEDIAKIQKYAKTCTIEYHDMSKLDTSKLVIRPEDHVTVEAYFRFFIPELLDKNIDKCLYLDSDIICTGNFEELFKRDISDYALGMVYDTNYSDIRFFNRLQYDMKYGYFNSGVCLINLDYWRKNDIPQKLFDYVAQYPERCWFHDQDAINYVCHSKILPLPVSYNVQNGFLWIYYWKNQKTYTKSVPNLDFVARNKFDEIEKGCNNPVFIHFTYIRKPWKLDNFAPFTKVWRFFLGKTEFKLSFQLKLRIKMFIKKIIKRPFDNKYPPDAYAVEDELLRSLYKNNI